MLINYRSLRLSESNKVDQVGEYFNESIMCRSCQVRKRKIIDTALDSHKSVEKLPLTTRRNEAYLHQQSPQTNKESHEISRVGRNNIRIIAAYIVSCKAHPWFNRIPRNIHKKLRKPLHNHLNLLGIGFYQIGRVERYADVVDTSCDFLIRLLSR